MLLRRSFGLLIGLFIGILPVVNFAFTAVISFTRKKRNWAIVYLIFSCADLAAYRIFYNYTEKKNAASPIFLSTFKQQLLKVSVNSNVPVDSVEMRTILLQSVRNTAEIVIQQDKGLESWFKNTREGKLSYSAKRDFEDLNLYLYRDYLNKAESKNGKDKYNLTFNTSQLNQWKLKSENKDNLAQSFILSENVVFLITNVSVMIILFFWGLVACTGRGWNLFVKAPVTVVVEPFRTNVHAAAAMNAQPTPPEPISAAPSFFQSEPPPLPEPAPEKIYFVGMVNVNQAKEEELMQLPGINRIMAKRIIAERNANGYFTDITEMDTRMDLAPDQRDRFERNLDFTAPKRGGGRVIEY